MAKYTYTEFFKKLPEIYHGFCDVVEHAKNFEAEIKEKSRKLNSEISINFSILFDSVKVIQ